MQNTIQASLFRPWRSEITAIVTFIPIGNAPKLKNNKQTYAGTTLFREISEYMRSACDKEDVHIYVNNVFEPLADQAVGDVARCWGKKGEYVMNVHYSVGKAYV